MLITLGPGVSRSKTTSTDSNSQEDGSQPVGMVIDPLAVPAAIQSIRDQVCQNFYMDEMRDPELTVPSNRRAYVLPRQIAMYIARQVTGASFQEIGRQFGGRHHSTVQHSIHKIDEMRRRDKALGWTVTRLTEACVRPCA
jgi:chromosomal replication initiator protein